MDTLQDQSKASEQSRSMAFHTEEAGQTFATAFLQPPPLQLAADRSHTVEKTAEPEEIFTPETQETVQAQQATPDIVSVLQPQKQEPESDEIKEPFSLELDFAAGPNDNPTDNDGEDNGTSIGDDGSAGAEENIGTIQQKEVGSKFNQNSNKKDQKSQNFSPDIQNFNSDQPIPTNDIMSQMEYSFGQDFSDVQIHENSETAQSLGAKAFAQGNDIHFAPGEYNPNSTDGRSLLGHELTHVVQQRQGRVQVTSQEKGFDLNDDTTLEKEADEMGAKAARGELLPFNVNNASAAENQTIQKKVMQMTEDPDQISRCAHLLKNELEATFDTDNEKVIEALVNSLGNSQALKNKYRIISTDNVSLVQALRGEYHEVDDIPMLYKTVGMAYGWSLGHDAIALAIALKSPLTDNGAVRSILYNTPLGSRQVLRRAYDRVYRNAGISHGLVADLEAALTGWDKLKSIMLLRQDLNTAQNIYGYVITGNHTRGVNLLTTEYNGQQDIAPLRNLQLLWVSSVKNEDWAPHYLRRFLNDNLDDAHRTQVNQLFISANLIQAHKEPEGYNALLESADAQAEGSVSTMDDDEESAYAAADSARASLEGSSEEDAAAGVERMEATVHGDLNDLEMRQYRHRLHLELTKADELYYKLEEEDWPGALAILDKCWKDQGLQDLQDQCRLNLIVDKIPLRPPFFPLPILRNITDEAIHTRSSALLLDGTNVEMGVRRLFAEILHGTNAVENMVSFLSPAGGARAISTVEAFVDNPVYRTWVRNQLKSLLRDTPAFGNVIGDIPTYLSASPCIAFTLACFKAYGAGSHFYDLQNLIDPVVQEGEVGAAMRARRAREQRDSAWFDISDLQERFNGERPSLSVERDVQNMERTAGLRDDETDEQMAERARSRINIVGDEETLSEEQINELSLAEMSDFQRDSEALRASNAAVSGLIATAVEVAIGLALAPASGGLSLLRALTFAVVSTASGMLTQELLLQNEYELLTEENLQALALSAATTGVTHGLGSMLTRSQRAAALARAVAAGVPEAQIENFIRAALKERERIRAILTNLANSFTQQSLEALFANHGITSEVIEQRLLAILTSVLGESLGAHMNERIAGDSEALLNELAGNFVDEIGQALAQSGASAPAARINNIDDLFNHFGPEVLPALGRAINSTLTDRLTPDPPANHEPPDHNHSEIPTEDQLIPSLDIDNSNTSPAEDHTGTIPDDDHVDLQDPVIPPHAHGNMTPEVVEGNDLGNIHAEAENHENTGTEDVARNEEHIGEETSTGRDENDPGIDRDSSTRRARESLLLGLRSRHRDLGIIMQHLENVGIYPSERLQTETAIRDLEESHPSSNESLSEAQRELDHQEHTAARYQEFESAILERAEHSRSNEPDNGSADATPVREASDSDRPIDSDIDDDRVTIPIDDHINLRDPVIPPHAPTPREGILPQPVDILDHDSSPATLDNRDTDIAPPQHHETPDPSHSDNSPTPPHETSLPNTLVNIEPVDTGTPSYDIDQFLVPDEAYTQHAVTRPEGDIASNLTNALSPDQGNHNEQQFVLDHVIADTRFYLAGDNARTLHSFAEMAGQCGMARDLSGALLQGMSNDPGLDVRSLTAENAFNQGDVESLGGSIPAQHAFSVARFPNGQAYIVDPSFSQFVSAGLTHEGIEDFSPDERSFAFPADQHLDGGVDHALVHELLDSGYIPLNPENAQAYGRLIGYGGTLDGDSIMTYMLNGSQDTEDSLSRQEVRASLQEQVNSYPENSPERVRFESMIDEI